MSASLVATTASARNVRTLTIRAIAGALLVSVAAVSAFALETSNTRTQAPVLTPAKIMVPARIAKPAAPAVPPEYSKAFLQESTMTTGQLIARWDPVIAAASKKFNVPEAWIRAVMRAESGGKTMLTEDTRIISTAGAMGLMQVMPDTYKILREEHNLGADAYDVRDNIFAGTAYLKWLHGKYGYPAMFAAYNAGPGRLEQHINDGKQLPTETRLYVGSITRNLNPEQGAVTLGVAKLTLPDGTPVSIEVKNITSVRAALPGEFAPGIQSVLKMGPRMQAVRESVDAATKAIKAASLTL